MKKFTAFVFFTTVMFTGICANAQSEPILRTSDMNRSSVLFTDAITGGQFSIQSFVSDVKPMLNMFRNSTENIDGFIDMSEYNISETTEDALYNTVDSLYETLVFCSPRSYYLIKGNGTYSYWFYSSYNAETNSFFLDGITPVYDLDIYDSPEATYDINFDKVEDVRDEVEENQAYFDNEISNIKSLVPTDLSDFQTLLAYHNYIDINYAYALDEERNFDICTHNNIIAMLKDKRSLCQTFAILYNYLIMDRGFETGFVTSHYLDNGYEPFHTWNIVCLTNEDTDWSPCWFHIDLTWDDLACEADYLDTSEQLRSKGGVSLRYFLISDEECRKTHDTTLNGATIGYGEAIVSEFTSNVYDDDSWHNISFYIFDTVQISNLDIDTMSEIGDEGEFILIPLPVTPKEGDLLTIRYVDTNGTIHFHLADTDAAAQYGSAMVESGHENWTVFFWNENLQPLCNAITSETV